MSLTFKFVSQIESIDRNVWQSLIKTCYPFIQDDYLNALEQSESVGGSSGWQPSHLTVVDGNEIVAVMPLYIKNHSYGEYVFDFQWANAFHQAGRSYYPKLLSAIPFTPATGPRIAIKNDIDKSNIDKNKVLQTIVEAIQYVSEDKQLSSWHVLFPSPELNQSLNNLAVFSRSGVQYHWFNQNYQNFDDFLQGCKQKKRKNIKRERRCLKDNGLTVKTFEQEEITDEIWRHFYFMYQMTYMKRSGHGGYLSENFFTRLSCSKEIKVMLKAAYQESQMIAAALFFYDDKNLYGRYLGCIKEFEFLHFELCYYQGIDFAISNQLDKFDAGAQGEHKISRGFQPVETYSNHWIKESDFSAAILQFVTQEKKLVQSVITESKCALPFK